jgi:circadian clock protein KaiB
MNDKQVLMLFVTGQSHRSTRAIDSVRALCEGALRGQCRLEVIDVLEQPQLAEDEKVLATPTLLRRFPPPPRRLIGDLSDPQRVLDGLNLYPDSSKNA